MQWPRDRGAISSHEQAMFSFPTILTNPEHLGFSCLQQNPKHLPPPCWYSG